MSAPKRTYKIAAIPADGVGKEVVAAGRRVLDALAEHSTERSASPGTSSTGVASTTPGTAG